MIFTFSLYIYIHHYISLYCCPIPIPMAPWPRFRGWTIIRQAVEVGRAMLPLGDEFRASLGFTGENGGFYHT